MSENIDTMETNVPMIADESLWAIAEQAEKRINAVIKIKQIVLKVTNQHDWIDQNGKPYLWTSGAEKIARVFGISWRIDEPVCDAMEGGHYSYTYKGYFTLGGVTIEAIGSRSSKDGFFKKYGKEKDGEGNKVELPASEIDKGDVKKSAYTNCIGNGITRLLGIRNMSWEELQAAGISRDKSGRVDYGSTKGERTGKISDAQKNRFYAIAKGAKKTDEQVKEYLLQTFQITTSNDILIANYEAACEWAKKPIDREPGEDG